MLHNEPNRKIHAVLGTHFSDGCWGPWPLRFHGWCMLMSTVLEKSGILYQMFFFLSLDGEWLVVPYVWWVPESKTIRGPELAASRDCMVFRIFPEPRIQTLIKIWSFFGVRLARNLENWVPKQGADLGPSGFSDHGLRSHQCTKGVQEFGGLLEEGGQGDGQQTWWMQLGPPSNPWGPWSSDSKSIPGKSNFGLKPLIDAFKHYFDFPSFNWLQTTNQTKFQFWFEVFSSHISSRVKVLQCVSTSPALVHRNRAE